MWKWWGGGKEFAYEIVEDVEVDPEFEDRCFWKLSKGIHKTDKTEVSIFTFQITPTTDTDIVDLCRNCVSKSKTLMLPHVLKYLDGIETPQSITIVTEAVVPLHTYLATTDASEGRSREFLSWGLHSVIQGLEHLHNGGILHGNIGLHSVYVNKCGDWKLFGLEWCSQMKSMDPNSPPKMNYLRMYHNHLPTELKSPELIKDNWSVVENSPVWATDSWALGLMFFELFNRKVTVHTAPSELKDCGKMPKSLFVAYMGLMSGAAKMRTNPAKLIDGNEYFNNEYVEVQHQIENMVLILRDTHEMDTFLRKLNAQIMTFPRANCKYKILPKLVEATKYGAGSTAALQTILKLGDFLTTEEFQNLVIPGLIALFSSGDQTVRIKLLQSAESYVKNFTPTSLAEIWPHVAEGFVPTKPAEVRELSVKALIHFVPQLPEKIVNTEVVKCIWAMQSDPEGTIRANTAICLSRLAGGLSADVRDKLLIPAFTRSLQDAFPHSRIAACNSFTATVDYYTTDAMAKKILPVVVMLTVDTVTDVRAAAFNCINAMLGKLRRTSDATASVDPKPSSSSTKSGATTASNTATGSRLGSSTTSSTGLNSSTTSASRVAPPIDDEYDDDDLDDLLDEEEEQEEPEDEEKTKPAGNGWGDDDWSDDDDDEAPAPPPKTPPKVVPKRSVAQRPASSPSGASPGGRSTGSAGASLSGMRKGPVRKSLGAVKKND
eukprot:TRINITY_DN6405_c0_g1_i1.p1 TRINITY_DN6405_c0_g1~~TRINITY_DN6405_c0_g1_i1.p1  ORF type:complete len:717 (+),score=96.18 TRINITY_DN6405_c0_g1_i1:53-2203(+)